MARKDSLSGQRYACDRPGCDKHYSRPDHLLRHKLNHDREKVLQCDQCDRTFVRQDLLTRHLERHALRGKTLGRWSNKRKQSAESDAEEDGDEDSFANESSIGNASMDGNGHAGVRSSRSYHAYPQQFSNSVSGDVGAYMGHPSTSAAAATSAYDTPFAFAPPPIQSPPQNYNYSGGGASSSARSVSASIGPPLPYDLIDQSPHQNSSSTSYNGGYGQQSHSRGSIRSTWDAPRQPSQHHSHQQQLHHHHHQSVPSPSQDLSNYPANANVSSSFISPLAPALQTLPLQTPGNIAFMGGQGGENNESIPSTLPEATALLHSAVSGSSHFPFSAPMASDDIADYDWLFDGMDPLIPGGLGYGETKSTEEATSSRSEASTTRETQFSSEQQMSALDEEQSDEKERQEGNRDQADALHDLAFFAGLQSDIPDEDTFNVDATAHARLLHFLSSSSLHELALSPLFSTQALRCYVYLFFTKLNAIYPLIHEPTFTANTADPMLLSAIIVCGAHFADDSAHFLAERIGRKLWGAFITFEDFRPARATLALLQAMLLTETFGKMMGTRPQHETAHLFHNFIVTLARRNAVFIPSKVRLPIGPLEDRWRIWSREEEKKRISLYSFILDAQHATIFRHVPALSSFQIHLHLPCDEDEWQAQSAEEWDAIRKGKQKDTPSFIAALKATLTPDIPLFVSDSDSFKHFVLLHGLMSIAYDLQWKQQALLAAPETGESVSNWKEKLTVSYRACQQRLEALPKPLRLIDRASLSLVEFAQIFLHADAVDIQIYAGLPTVLGRFIDHHTFSVARKSCREWGKTADARIAVWHAARFLRSSLLLEEDSNMQGKEELFSLQNNGFDELLHQQWVQYLCTLVIWAYEQALVPVHKNALAPPSRPRSREQDVDAESNASSVTNTNPHIPPTSACPTPTRKLTAMSSTSLQKPAGATAQYALSEQPVPSVTTPLHKTICQAKHFLDTLLDFDPWHDDGHFDIVPRSSTAVLELVERLCRTSRWEVSRECSGVLRKLIRERSQPQSQPYAQPPNAQSVKAE